MKAISIGIGIGVIGLMLSVVQADTKSLVLTPEPNTSMPELVEADSDELMQELCAGYADDEGLQGNEREKNIKDCLLSMTSDLSDMEATAAKASEALIDNQVTHPEALIADELVEKPLPGAEELIPKTPIQTE